MLGNFTEINNQTDSVVIDIETHDPLLKKSGASWAKKQGHILGIACKIDNEPASYYSIRHKDGNHDYQQVKNYFYNTIQCCYDHDIPIIMHYGYYDLGWLDYEGFMDINRCPPLFDTLIGGQLYKSDMVFALKMMARFFRLGEKIDLDIDLLPQMSARDAARYANNDAELTGRLYERLLPEINPEAAIREMGVVPILVMMKKNGIKVDMEKLEELDRRFTKILDECMIELMQYDPKIKIWSNSSIEFLFRKLGLGYPRTDLGNPSFTQGFLSGVPHPLIQTLSKARKIHKLKGTFVEGIRLGQFEGYVHTDYFNGRSEGGGTITGRLSSANPNIQQVPSRSEEGMMIRDVFIADNALWTRFDYSQQEPRLMLHYAALLDLPGIDYWKDLYAKNPNQDFYDVLTKLTNIHDRFVMKTNTLALSYGMGEDHMSDIMGIPVLQAREYKRQFGESVPWLPKLKDHVTRKAIQAGKIKTLGNRYLNFTNATADKAFNHMIQGSAADQTKQAMLDIYKITGKVPLNQVHDELNYPLTIDEVMEEQDEVLAQIMKDAFQLTFPTKVDCSIGTTWKEACEK